MSTRMPYGMAKRIVAEMQLGESRTVRPEWVVPIHNAARRMGLRIMSVAIHEGDERKYRIIRVPERLAVSGHKYCRRPRRDELSGRFLRT